MTSIKEMTTLLQVMIRHLKGIEKAVENLITQFYEYERNREEQTIELQTLISKEK